MHVFNLIVSGNLPLTGTRMNTFIRSTANIAAWNLEGLHGIPDERIEKQVQGLAMPGAEIVAIFHLCGNFPD